MLKILFVIISYLPIGIINLYAQDSTAVENIKLTDSEVGAFREQAITSVTDLSRYIKIIGEKNRELSNRKKAIELAIGLFSSEENIIQVSSLHGETQTFSIREYFTRLLNLPYYYVSITWFDIYLARDFIPGPNGKYFGAATISQKFEGKFNKEMGPYLDVTKKKITLIIEKIKDLDGLKKEERWVLKLGDIMVEETQIK